MCFLKLEVAPPVVHSFILTYHLRDGCIVILTWTAIRSFLCAFFSIVAILEVFLKRKLPCGGILVTDMTLLTVDPRTVMLVYFAFVGLLVAESLLFVFCFYLARGVYLNRSRYFVQYLVCRLLTWLLEVLCLVLLCIKHKFLIGWYLGILFFVILESYAFIVVYSYYCELWDCENPCKIDEDASDVW